ncbi:protein kinase domain-containing protein [Planctomycetaceae bacterium SH139]
MEENKNRLSTAQREQLDRIADEFEHQLQTGGSPGIETHVRDYSDLMPELLLELITVEREYRVGHSLEEYQRRFPSYAEVIDRRYGETKEMLHSTEEAGTEPESREWIDQYKILQPIGKGGMGQVFMAEQQLPVKRRVAIKVIKSEFPTREILARFEAERQALAMMDHQNIAKVLDCGTTAGGRPYFAMELVRGIPITSYCDQNKLSTRERLVLFSQACRAIQHSHQKGVAHRDIKPSNILVTHYDGQPVVKVIDFGLAKAVFEQTKLTDRTLFTRFGQVVGTLEYMSPEQAEFNALDVDSRTDIYSLGVLLYELLTGCTPLGKERLKSEALDRILYLIREEEAPRPSTRLSKSDDGGFGVSMQRQTNPSRLTSILRGELDWIAIKALEKDRTRRYATAEALAEDITRFLNDDPIEARPPSLSYRLRKTAHKYKATFATGVAILSLLIVALVATTLLWIRARDSEARYADANAQTQQEMRRAEQARQVAEEAEESARALAGELEETLANHNAARITSAITVGNFHEARQAFEQHFGGESTVAPIVSTRVAQRILFPGHKTWFHGASLDELVADYDGIDEVKAYAEGLKTYTGLSQDEFRWWSPQSEVLAIPKEDRIDVFRGDGPELIDRLIEFDQNEYRQELEKHRDELEKPQMSSLDLSENPFEALRESESNAASQEASLPLRDKPKFVSFSPNGTTLVVAFENAWKSEEARFEVRCFDISSQEVLWTIKRERIDCLEHVGRYVAISADEDYDGDRIELLDPASGQSKRIISDYRRPIRHGLCFTRTLTVTDDSKLIGLLSSGQVWELSLLGDNKRQLIEQEIALGEFQRSMDPGIAFDSQFMCRKLDLI